MLDEASYEEQARLAADLHGRVREALESPHANHVVQKVVEVMPPVALGFVLHELSGVVAKVARHRFGCRILCRLIEHCAQPKIEGLVDEVLFEVSALCRHSFGNYVVQRILEYGSPQHRRAVIDALSGDLLGFATHSIASHVVQNALLHSAAEERRDLLRPLLCGADAGAGALVRLACGRDGNFVARTLLQLPGNEAIEVRSLLESVAPALAKSNYGKRVLACLDSVSQKRNAD